MWDKVSWSCRSNFGGPQESKKMCKLKLQRDSCSKVECITFLCGQAKEPLSRVNMTTSCLC
jgi:hypothetical protein